MLDHLLNLKNQWQILQINFQAGAQLRDLCILALI